MAAYPHGLAARLAAAGGDEHGVGGPPRQAAPIGAADVVRAIPRAFRAL